VSVAIEYRTNTASASEIAEHLRQCDADFVPPLSGRVAIDEYAKRIAERSIRLEAWAGSALIGLVAVYTNDLVTRIAFITSVSVRREWMGEGLAGQLLRQSLEAAAARGMQRIRLEVGSENEPAIRLYEASGFAAMKENSPFLTMELTLKDRDYDTEAKDKAESKYAYNFDFDVMHPFMIRSFQPFFKKGSLLELGSFKGDFTRRFLSFFDDITCVEASGEAVAEAKKRLGDRVTFVNALFEEVKLPKRYDHVMLTHVLEHLDNPVLVLRRINKEWLADGGRLFLVCPNANAPSRQIAVKMGLIPHNAAVTPAERDHGHRMTYSLDTLERDARAAGLRVVHRSGIFFKALANFQWDRLLQTDIISKEYLEGCYQLGQQYPDLCSSIFLMCERGD